MESRGSLLIALKNKTMTYVVICYLYSYPFNESYLMHFNKPYAC